MKDQNVHNRISIRVRVTLALAVVLILGFATTDIVTFVSVRSFLSQRIDAQLASARLPIERYLDRLTYYECPSLTALEDIADPNTYILTFNLKASTSSGLNRFRGCSSNKDNIVDNPRFPSGSDINPDPAPKLPSTIHFSMPTKGRVYDPRIANENLSSFQVAARGDSHFLYRVQAVPLPRGAVLVVAAPLEPMNNTLANLIDVEVVVSIIAFMVMVGLSILIVRRGLYPLVGMARQAESIAGGDYSQRVEPANPMDEAGRLGLALNEMLSQIEIAFAQKEESEARLRRFLADISHELRTPLTSIRGYAELFFRGAKNNPEDLDRALSRIQSEAERMNKLVNDLLLLARLDQGRELEFTSINICDIVREAVADALLSNTDREIALNCSDEVLFDGDQDRIRQLVSNLLNNAFDHTPEGTSVEISLYQSEESVILEVSDQGSGVEPELQEKIFDRFVSTKNLRADELSKSISSGAVIGDGENTESTSNDETRTQSTGHDAFLGGTGLGLSIARAIARGHGGDIELVANGEKGAKFKVTLPKSASLRSGKS